LRVTPFWGGYRLEFKLIEVEKLSRCRNDLAEKRRNALQIGGLGKFQVDISKYEYCGGKRRLDFDGYSIFVYTPEMMVSEKLRAICQQMPAYGNIVKRGRAGTARGRDFVDIHGLVTHFRIDMTSESNRTLISLVFEAKKVPLGLLGEVGGYREFHRPDFQVVKDTVKAGVQLREFDFYFDFVVGLCTELETLWHM